MVEGNCTLCSELTGKQKNNLCYLIFRKKINRIIKETNNFVIIPTIGQITEGYLLIVPKEHYTCIGALPLKLFQELKELKEICIDALYKIYQKSCIFFEHGAVGKTFEKRAGCCTDHAHLHVIPVELDLLEDIRKNYKELKINSIEELSKNYQKKIPYLFYEDNNKDMYVFDAPSVVPQYFRMLLAKKLKVEEKWDWRTYYGKEEMSRTIKRLTKIIE